MEDQDQDHLLEMDLQIDSDVRQQLYEAAKWSKSISIVMFIACGLVLFFVVIGGTALFSVFRNFGSEFDIVNEFGGAVLIAIIVIVVAVVALIYYFLFNFSQKIKTALISDNTEFLNAGLKSLKIFFIITTVFAILSLVNSVAQIFR